MTTCRPYEKFAQIYDSIMPDNFYGNYYEFVIEILQKLESKPASILELACGTGKLARLFLDRGYNIEGLDLSTNMLKVAQAKGLKVYQSNMIDFELNRKYDLILCVYDSLNYLQKGSDLQHCFNSVKKHLSQDGLFIFDLNSDHKINEVIPNNPVKTEYRKIGDIEFIWLNSTKPESWISELIFFQKMENGKYLRFYEKHIEKAYGMNEVKHLLKEANLEILASYSDFEFSEIEKDSMRWFFVCKPS